MYHPLSDFFNMTESKWKHKLFLLKNKRCSHQEVKGETTTKKQTRQTRRLKSSRKLCHCEPKDGRAQMSPSSQAAAGICDSINNMPYNGVLVGDKDLAHLSITKTSGISISKEK